VSSGAGAGRVASLAFAIAFVVLLANGRPIGSGDTGALEKTAGSLVEHGTFVLSEDGYSEGPDGYRCEDCFED